MKEGDAESEPSGDPVIDGSGETVAFLVSPAASYIAGIALPADSGWSRGAC